jgi:hypothetical protein
MKRPILTAVLALAAWAVADNPAGAWHKCQFSCGMSFCRESTGWSYCCSRSFGCNPPPCCPGGCSYGGPAPFDHPPAYGGPPPDGPPGFVAPQPTPANPAPKTGATPTAQQVGYTPQAGYGYAGYGYGYGYGSGYGYAAGAGYSQAPSYWYGE